MQRRSCEAAQRPTMRFVAVKTKEQQARGMLFHTRDLLVRQRTQTINALRGHLAEFGFVAPQGWERRCEISPTVAAGLSRCGRSKTLPDRPFPATGRAGAWNTVELYRKVRLACRDGMSERAAALHFGISRESVKKMLWLFGASGLSADGTGSAPEAGRVHRDHRPVAEGGSEGLCCKVRLFGDVFA